MKVRFAGFHDTFSVNVSSVAQFSSHPDKVIFAFSTSSDCRNAKMKLLDMGIPSEFCRDHSTIAVPVLQGFAWEVYS